MLEFLFESSEPKSMDAIAAFRQAQAAKVPLTPVPKGVSVLTQSILQKKQESVDNTNGETVCVEWISI